MQEIVTKMTPVEAKYLKGRVVKNDQNVNISLGFPLFFNFAVLILTGGWGGKRSVTAPASNSSFFVVFSLMFHSFPVDL